MYLCYICDEIIIIPDSTFCNQKLPGEIHKKQLRFCEIYDNINKKL